MIGMSSKRGGGCPVSEAAKKAKVGLQGATADAAGPYRQDRADGPIRCTW